MHSHSQRLARFGTAAVARLWQREALSVLGGAQAAEAALPQSLPPGPARLWRSHVRDAASTAGSPPGSEAPPVGPEDPDDQLPPYLRGKTVAHLTNAPTHALRHDVVAFFTSRNLRPGAVTTVLDSHLYSLCWRLVFDREADFRAAQRLVGSSQRMGGRRLDLTAAPPAELAKEKHPRHPNREAETHRGRTLLVSNVQDDIGTESLERFFVGFHLAPHPFKLVRVEHNGVRTPLRKRVKGEIREYIRVKKLRVLVKFATELEAQRALREKYGEYLDEVAVELRLVF